ncbi:hypothetical protein AMATHDRAFT_60766 [Amanita thiersii Skay4041]|uniref:DNA repair and recombination protein RAD52 n=1 Tax=Amanita thiersii Skay4041 TaxID=703135 RepID=A0A2A9NKM6_9AGAR|nr:hypothetical protein AMATHDRAFT_60766 [Amanita thiersii Skay4041]
MHGTPIPFSPHSFGTQISLIPEGISEESARKIALLQVKLNQKLGPEYISHRPGPSGGPKLTYVEGWKIINLANEVFGFNGWSSRVVSITTDYLDYHESTQRFNAGVTAVVRVTLRDGTHHEDAGFGAADNVKSKSAALDKCKKEAVTDSLKRALRSFGNILGNCLYDKSYTEGVSKIKVQPPRFDASQLHRRPEFEDTKPIITSSSTTVVKLNNNNSTNTSSSTSTNIPQQNQRKPIPAIPPHMRPEASTAANNKPRTPHMPQHQQNANPTTTTFTTPSHNQSSRIPNNIKPQNLNPPPPQRRVAFSETSITGTNASNLSFSEAEASSPKATGADAGNPGCIEDEAFNFSQDDAFFASIDLGGVDIGMPIEEETGRPLDYEEEQSESAASSRSTSCNQQTSRNSANVTSMRPEAVTKTPIPPQAQKRQGGIPTLTTTGTARQDPNLPPPGPNADPPKSIRKTPVGSFNFPPGMNPFQQETVQRPAGQFNQANTAAKAGTKRPMEYIMTGYQPGVRSGMGLQNAQGHHSTSTSLGSGSASASGSREVLGQLDMSEGGDVKRIKR